MLRNVLLLALCVALGFAQDDGFTTMASVEEDGSDMMDWTPEPLTGLLEGNPNLDKDIRDPCIQAATSAFKSAMEGVVSGIAEKEKAALAANNELKQAILEARQNFENVKLEVKAALEDLQPKMTAAREAYDTAAAACPGQEDAGACYATARAAYDSAMEAVGPERDAAIAKLEEGADIRNETITELRAQMTELQSNFYGEMRGISLDRKLAEDTYKAARISCKEEAIIPDQSGESAESAEAEPSTQSPA